MKRLSNHLLSILSHMMIILFLSLGACDKDIVDPECKVNIPGRDDPFEKLSQYCLFQHPINQLQPVNGVLSYELNTPLFSDYANKARFIYSGGKAIKYAPEKTFDFPVGSILIKNFFYGEGEEKFLLETRLLIHYPEGWIGLPYVWNDKQNDAFLTIGGADINIERPDAKGVFFKYKVPNQNQCKGCHSVNNQISPIGPKAGNLNRSVLINGSTLNQLEYWASWDILDDFNSLDDTPRYAVWNDPSTGSLEDRARAYLDANCGHCHRPEGPANNSGLNLYFQETNKSKLGFCKLPVSAGQGSGGLPYDIVPGDPDQSIMIYRMSSTDPRAKMPEIGRQLIHKEGVELIREWIASLEDDPCDG